MKQIGLLIVLLSLSLTGRMTSQKIVSFGFERITFAPQPLVGRGDTVILMLQTTDGVVFTLEHDRDTLLWTARGVATKVIRDHMLHAGSGDHVIQTAIGWELKTSGLQHNSTFVESSSGIPETVFGRMTYMHVQCGHYCVQHMNVAHEVYVMLGIAPTQYQDVILPDRHTTMMFLNRETGQWTLLDPDVGTSCLVVGNGNDGYCSIGELFTDLDLVRDPSTVGYSDPRWHESHESQVLRYAAFIDGYGPTLELYPAVGNLEPNNIWFTLPPASTVEFRTVWSKRIFDWGLIPELILPCFSFTDPSDPYYTECMTGMTQVFDTSENAAIQEDVSKGLFSNHFTDRFQNVENDGAVMVLTIPPGEYALPDLRVPLVLASARAVRPGTTFSLNGKDMTSLDQQHFWPNSPDGGNVPNIDSSSQVYYIRSVSAPTATGGLELTFLFNPLAFNFWQDSTSILIKSGSFDSDQIVTSTTDETLPSVRIWPNPVSDYLRITGAAESEIQLYNMAAQRVSSFSVAREDELFDLSFLTNGMYIVHVIQNGKVIHTGRIQCQ